MKVKYFVFLFSLMLTSMNHSTVAAPSENPDEDNFAAESLNINDPEEKLLPSEEEYAENVLCANEDGEKFITISCAEGTRDCSKDYSTEIKRCLERKN